MDTVAYCEVGQIVAALIPFFPSLLANRSNIDGPFVLVQMMELQCIDPHHGLCLVCM